MSPEEKASYHQKAKDGGGTTFIKEERCDTRGVPLNWKEREEQKKISEKDHLLQKVEDMISYFATQGSTLSSKNAFFPSHSIFTIFSSRESLLLSGPFQHCCRYQ